MGETSPPTAVDYAGMAAHDAIMQVQAMMLRVRHLESLVARMVAVIDSEVAGLSKRVAALEDDEPRCGHPRGSCMCEGCECEACTRDEG